MIEIYQNKSIKAFWDFQNSTNFWRWCVKVFSLTLKIITTHEEWVALKPMTTPKNKFRHIGYLNKSQIVVGRNVDCTTRRRSYDLVSPVDVIWRRRIRRRRLIQRNRKTLSVDDQLWGGVTSSQSDSLHDAKILFFFTNNFI